MSVSESLSSQAIPELWAGNLLKLSHGGMKGWKKRYFLLETGRLSYYDKSSSSQRVKPVGVKPLSTTPLQGTILQFIENADISDASRHHLYLNNPENGLDLTLGCGNIDEALQWKTHFEKHIEFANKKPDSIAPAEEVASRRVSKMFRSKHSGDHSDVMSISSYGSASTEGGSRKLNLFPKKKRQSRGVEVDWGDGGGWNGSHSLTSEALSQHTQNLQQVNRSQNDSNTVDELALVTEFPVESEEQPPPPTSNPASPIAAKNKTSSSSIALLRSESAPDSAITASLVEEESKKKRSKSLIPRFGLPPLVPHTHPSSPENTISVEPKVDETIRKISSESEASTGKSSNLNTISEVIDSTEEIKPEPTLEDQTQHPLSPGKKKERKSLLGKLGLGKSTPTPQPVNSGGITSQPIPESSSQSAHSVLPPSVRVDSSPTIKEETPRSRSNSRDDTELRKKRTTGLFDMLGIHKADVQEQSVVVPQPPPPPRYYISVIILLPHGTHTYASPNSNPRLLVKVKRVNCGDIIPVHAMRILDGKHWYESDNGWLEGPHERSDKLPQMRGLIFCSNGIPIKAKVLKLHFMEVIKKGWFRSTATYETDFILEISYLSPETGFENFSILRLRRSFRSLEVLQNELSKKYPELAWQLFDLTVHGFPVLTDGAIGLLEDPDRVLQLMEAMGVWFSAVLSKVDVQSCTELNHFLRPSEADCNLMDIDLSAVGGLNGAWNAIG